MHALLTLAVALNLIMAALTAVVAWRELADPPRLLASLRLPRVLLAALAGLVWPLPLCWVLGQALADRVPLRLRAPRRWHPDVWWTR